ncbi:hypothetical protein CRI93_14825 [Longimonas halophila]|uniref:VCBS repeat-containing protein n=1 Tax=Longimonas halophila TaxID=1469170 RepID=A0A2H3NI57_9BACT|nr:VCBS repeat-containing protein [Longimonas halophila]PEN04630.1 hypothetical protein CRI93_14825 [Longimonas halophila]
MSAHPASLGATLRVQRFSFRQASWRLALLASALLVSALQADAQPFAEQPFPTQPFPGQLFSSQPFADSFEITTDADGAFSVHGADIDGDGDEDVLSTSLFDDTIAWYRNGDATGGDGDGSAWTQTEITTKVDFPTSVYAVDLDGDGDADVVSASLRDDTITFYRNGDATSGDGDGSTWTETAITTKANGAVSVYAADIDGDGDQDVLSASQMDDTIALYRNGDATSGDGDGSTWTQMEITTKAEGAYSVHAADIDGDGDQDVLSASIRDDTIAFYRNGDATSGDGDGSAWTETEITTEADRAYDVYAADIDGDGDQDVLSASEGDDTIAWYRNGNATSNGVTNGNGDGSMWTEIEIAVKVDFARGVHAADIDGDGDQDALSASNGDDTIAFHRNGDATSGNGDGSTWTETEITTKANGAVSVYAADLDGDGDEDVLSASQTDDTIAWYENLRVDDRRIDDAASVELTRFTAERESEAVVLNWQTAAEQNNEGFEIQRRQAVGRGLASSPASNWERIGYVEGAGTTDDPQRYRFRNPAPPTGSLVYRLKQIDTDGIEAFSDPVVIP